MGRGIRSTNGWFGSVQTLAVLAVALFGTTMGMAVVPGVVHPAAPPGPGCNPYTIYGYVNQTNNLGIRTNLLDANVWINATFVNTGSNNATLPGDPSGTFTWFAHSSPQLNYNGYQVSLPCTYAAGPGGYTVSVFGYKYGEYNVSATNGTYSINTATTGNHIDLLLKAPALAATVTATPSSGEAPLTVTFTSTHTGGTAGYSFAWNFGDGNNGVTAIGTTSHQYTSAVAETYTVTLTLTDSIGDTLVVTTTVTINADPEISSFGAIIQHATSSDALNNSQMVIFNTGVSFGTPDYTYAYTFGINGTSPSGSKSVGPIAATTDTLDHWYAGEATGDYTSTGKFFSTDSATQWNVSVTDADTKTTAPSSSTLWVYNISAHANVHPADAGQSVTFTGTAEGGSGTYTYSWRFGDGDTTPAATLVAAHTFTAAGTYVVNFTVNDSTAHAGNSVSTTYTITINPALVVAPTGTPNPTDVGTAVVFSSGASGGTTPYNYGWRYGDAPTGGTIPSLYATPTHTFNATGSFTVREYINDSAGASTSGTTLVVVNSDPVVSLVVDGFGGHPTAFGYVGESLTFFATASGGTGGLSCDFSYGDTHSSGYQACTSVPHSYTTAGPYSATVTVKDGLSVLGTSSPYAITIDPALTSVTISTNLTHPGGEIDLSVTLSGSVSGATGVPWYHFNWTFGDGSPVVEVDQSSSISPNEVHTYVTAALVTASVTVTDNQGETSTASTTINVVPVLAASANGVATAGNLDPPVNETFSVTPSGGSGTISTYAWTLGGGNTSTAPSPTWTYWSSGTYTVSVLITDSYGDKAGASYTFMVTGSSTYEDLDTGWNLIGMPGTAQNYNLWFLWEDLVLRGANPTSTQVSIQNTGGGLPLNYTFQGGVAGSAAVADQAVGDDRGIWVYVATAQTIGLSASTVSTPATENLQAGWNTLGWIMPTGTTASQLQLNNIPSGTQISMWDGVTQEYTTYVVGYSGASYDFTISNGEGILVWVPSVTTFSE